MILAPYGRASSWFIIVSEYEWGEGGGGALIFARNFFDTPPGRQNGVRFYAKLWRVNK